MVKTALCEQCGDAIPRLSLVVDFRLGQCLESLWCFVLSSGVRDCLGVLLFFTFIQVEVGNPLCQKGNATIRPLTATIPVCHDFRPSEKTLENLAPLARE